MEELNKLFKRWLDRDREQARFNDEKLFTRDGIIDEKRWGNVPKERRVLFILKEPGTSLAESIEKDDNVKKGHIPRESINSLCDLFRLSWKGVKFRNFHPLGRWAHGLINIDNSPSFKESNQKLNKDEAFLSSAVMNMKKIPARTKKNDSWVCDPEKLSEYAEMHKDHIKEEIDLIDPGIIVWCGTFDVLNSKTLSHGRKFIKMCHPQASKWNTSEGKSIRCSEEKYDYLLESYNKIS